MSKIKILVIDDDKEILFAMSAICEYKGWIPITALSVEEGIKKFTSVKPDVVLIDYHLPQVNGIEGVKRLREVSNDIPIIVLTIEEDQKVADKFIKAGANDFALKPIKAPDIIARINVHLRFKETIDNVNKNSIDYSKGISVETLNIIEKYMKNNNRYDSINSISKNTGLAYQTVHRYLQYMIEQNKVETQQSYGKIGRPKQAYKYIV
ncbi:response regulator [uncultured Clostridium sp.]|uniref:response regulator n=1 Tax=uncultured Clostridium sp. TaxID=59620 RepID=UPI0028E59935|nr:response regulator [uncultured Clostridium sp.]